MNPRCNVCGVVHPPAFVWRGIERGWHERGGWWVMRSSRRP